MPSEYSQDFRDRVVRMVLDHQAAESGSRTAAVVAVCPALGIGKDTLRTWVHKYAGSQANHPARGETADEEIVRLRRENTELRRANDRLNHVGFFRFSTRLKVPRRGWLIFSLPAWLLCDVPPCRGRGAGGGCGLIAPLC